MGVDHLHKHNVINPIVKYKISNEHVILIKFMNYSFLIFQILSKPKKFRHEWIRTRIQTLPSTMHHVTNITTWISFKHSFIVYVEISYCNNNVTLPSLDSCIYNWIVYRKNIKQKEDWNCEVAKRYKKANKNNK